MPGYSILSFKNPYLFFHVAAINISYVIFLFATLAAFLYLIQDYRIKHKKSSVFVSRLPDLSFLDKMNYHAIGLGFPILTLSIVSGAFWARDVGGAYWGWNPREVYSLALWLIYALILHVRLWEKLRGRKIAFLSLSAFFVIVLSLFSSCP